MSEQALIPLPDYNLSGQPNKYTPDEVVTTVINYFNTQIEQEKPIVITDISIALGMHRDSIHAMLKGEIGRTPELKKQYSDAIKWLYGLVENYREKLLSREKGNVTGVIFALKNHHGWRDEKHLNVQTEEKQTLTLQLPEDLAAKLTQNAGDSVDIVTIEGECD